MHTNGICTHCGKKIRFGISLCNECENKKRYNAAMVSQNKKKLKNLLEQNCLNIERLNKFIIYSNNIVKYSKVVMEYKKKRGSIGDVIKKFGIITCRFILLIGIVLIQI